MWERVGILIREWHETGKAAGHGLNVRLTLASDAEGGWWCTLAIGPAVTVIGDKVTAPDRAIANAMHRAGSESFAPLVHR